MLQCLLQAHAHRIRHIEVDQLVRTPEQHYTDSNAIPLESSIHQVTRWFGDLRRPQSHRKILQQPVRPPATSADSDPQGTANPVVVVPQAGKDRTLIIVAASISGAIVALLIGLCSSVSTCILWQQVSKV
jgi:hypothetical protein